MLPEARGDELAEEPLPFQHLADADGLPFRLLGSQVEWNGVVVVKLHAVEAELLVFANLGREGHLFANRRTERIAAGADVPGAKGEAIRRILGGHSSSLPRMPMIG